MISVFLFIFFSTYWDLKMPTVHTVLQECRSWDVYTMLISYSIFSSLLFCFTMSFLFSLCILGSPLLSHTYDPGSVLGVARGEVAQD